MVHKGIHYIPRIYLFQCFSEWVFFFISFVRTMRFLRTYLSTVKCFSFYANLIFCVSFTRTGPLKNKHTTTNSHRYGFPTGDNLRRNTYNFDLIRQNDPHLVNAVHFLPQIPSRCYLFMFRFTFHCVEFCTQVVEKRLSFMR